MPTTLPTEQQPDEPVLILQGGTDSLQLVPGGRVYHPGDSLPKLDDDQRLSLQASGVRFTTRHPEPVPTVPPPVEPQPTTDDQPAPRAPRTSDTE